MRSLKCPTCGAAITLQDGDREFAFCNYCGDKIMLDDFRSTHRIIDEAKIKQAEVELNQIEYQRIQMILEEQRKNKGQKWKKARFILGMIFIVSGLLMIVVCYALMGITDKSDYGLLAVLGFLPFCIGGAILLNNLWE